MIISLILMLVWSGLFCLVITEDELRDIVRSGFMLVAIGLMIVALLIGTIPTEEIRVNLHLEEVPTNIFVEPESDLIYYEP